MTLNENKESQWFDLIFLYANPLVSNICDIPIKEQINFDKEIEIFKHLFCSIENEIYKPKVIIDIASIDNLYKYFGYKTKIFHLSCHGCYDPIYNQFKFDENQNEEYTLYLENLGVLSKLSKRELNKFLNDNYPFLHIDLLFLSSCHSEEIQDIFIERKVKAIISISSLCEISEDSAMLFSEVFYTQIILHHQSINSSFIIAKNKASKMLSGEGYDCNCHSHFSTCKYNNKINQDNESEDNSNCSCIYTAKNQTNESNAHILKCEYADYLITKYDFITQIDISNEMQRICCCSIDIIHNESSKFLLYSSEDFRLFNTKPNLIIHKTCLNKYDFISGVIGRKSQFIIAIKNIISPSIRVLTIHGEKGIGKYSFAHILFKYCHDRGYFRDGVISINTSLNNELLFIQEIKQNLHLSNDANEKEIKDIVYKELYSKDMIIIVKKNDCYYNAFIQSLLIRTEKLKVIITSLNNTSIYNDLSKEANLNLIPLDSYYTLELFNYLTQNKINYRIGIDSKEKKMINEMISSSKGKHTLIYDIANQLRNSKFI